VAAIRTEGLVKRFGEITAVDGIDLEVAEGQLFGLLGPNGAGKTTTINILATLLKPTAGRAFIDGIDVVDDPSAVRKRIGIVFQDPSLDEELTGMENLRFHARLYKVPRAKRDPRIEELLALVELADRKDDRVKTYSGGMRRRLEIARGLIHDPRVLFLDEPTLGLDPQTRQHIWEYIQRLNREQNVTMVLTTHYMDEADSLCDRLAIIDRGRIVAQGSPGELKNEIGGDLLYLSVNGAKQDALAIVEGLDAVRAAKETTDGIQLEVDRGEETIPVVLDAVRARGVGVKSISLQKPTLNDVFIKHTGRAIRDETMDHQGRMSMYMRGRRR
jgi:ABC-2 type transport system ATP-binding protein